MNTKEIIVNCLAESLAKPFRSMSEKKFEEIYEIRIRVNKPMIIYSDGEEIIKEEIVPKKEDIRATLELMSNYSLYAFEEEIKNGFITIMGGHRVGIAGKTIIEGGLIKTIKDICSINIRIAHQIIGCSDKILSCILDRNKVYHTLIVSPPLAGKTTMLRDIVRQLSNGTKALKGITVGVVDERSEIAACYKGVPQNDIGIRTDVIDACPKAKGMLLLLRAMSPRVIAVDEIGHKEDIYALEEVLNAGVKIICTVHGETFEDIKMKPVLSELLRKKIFEKVIILGHSNSQFCVRSIISYVNDN